LEKKGLLVGTLAQSRRREERGEREREREGLPYLVPLPPDLADPPLPLNLAPPP